MSYFRPSSSHVVSAYLSLGVFALAMACQSETGEQTSLDPSLAGTGAEGQETAGTGGSSAASGSGGSGGSAGDSGSAESDPWCNALAVFRTSCQSCHGDALAGGAPFPLVSYEHTRAMGTSDPDKVIHELIGARIHDGARPMPPRSQTPLTAEQLAALDTWLAAGAPNAASECGNLPEPPTEPAELEWPEDCEELYEIRASVDGQPYVVPANTEEQRNFEIPVPWSGRGEFQALAIRPITNNKRVVHHWILYHGLFDFITSWSPGKPMETFPDDVGVYMPSSGMFRLEMHYFNVGNPNDEPDTSGLEVCLTRNPRPKTAATFMFTGSANVPANSAVTNTSTCNVTARQPVHLITSSPHMHSYGVHATLEIIRQDGSVEVLEDSEFNWEDQHVTPIDAILETGDRVRMSCSYVNTTSRNIRFGSSSEDEMCFNFARYYPKDAFQCRSSTGLF